MNRSSFTQSTSNDGSYNYYVSSSMPEASNYSIKIFSIPKVVQIILDSMQFMQDNQRMRIYGYVIMINHLHIVASADKLSKEFGDFKSYTARNIIDSYKIENKSAILKKLAIAKRTYKTDRDYQFWQEGNKPKQIFDKKVMKQKIEYMHFNPIRCGFIDLPEHWRYSSARDYLGQDGLISICKDW